MGITLVCDCPKCGNNNWHLHYKFNGDLDDEDSQIYIKILNNFEQVRSGIGMYAELTCRCNNCEYEKIVRMGSD